MSYPEDWLPALSRPEVQRFILQNESKDAFDLALSGKDIDGISIKLIARQIQARQKARIKLPEWIAIKGIIFPLPENLEQASSEATARYKAEILKGNALVDLTGGTGIDTYYLSAGFDRTTYVEPDRYLCALAEYNFNLLNARVAVQQEDAQSYLRKNLPVDAYYIDPSRRDMSQNRVYQISDCSPDVAEIMALIPSSSHMLVKLSPMLDINKAIETLESCVEAVHVVAVNNEVKELLFLTGQKTDNPPITAVNLTKSSRTTFSFTRDEELKASINLSECKQFIYEANSAIMKAGAFTKIGATYGLYKLGKHTHLYTSSEVVDDFPGRTIQVEWHGSYQPAKIKKLIGSKKANIQARNFPDDVASIRKKTGLKDGGSVYLFFYRDLYNNPVYAGGSKYTG